MTPSKPASHRTAGSTRAKETVAQQSRLWADMNERFEMLQRTSGQPDQNFTS